MAREGSQVDTQILIAAFLGGASPRPAGSALSSVVAKEFLHSYTSDPAADRYYVPTSPGWAYAAHRWPRRFDPARSNHPFARRVTDQLILYFGSAFPTIREFGSFAYARVINDRDERSLSLALSHLSKRQRSATLSRFSYLCDHDMLCVPLRATTATIAQQLLLHFVEKYAPKRNFRNTLNDILILATAIEAGASLRTEDSVLSRFAASEFAGNSRSEGAWLRIDFSPQSATRPKGQRESKGFVNRGWKVREMKGLQWPNGPHR
ncbi:MAG: hypothetical protein L6R43_02860 [Planctomycetes bacterium]|nr:hypothetical protein [Planctomycetota bacterium]